MRDFSNPLRFARNDRGAAQRYHPLVISTEVEKSLLHDKHRALGVREHLVAHAAERKLAQGA